MDEQQIAGEIEQVRGPKRRGGKWWFALVVALVVGAIATRFMSSHGINGMRST